MTTRRGLTGWHVLWIAFSTIGVVVVVNMFFVFAALRSHSGVDVGDAYTLGLAYNDQIATREAQAALGWVPSTSTEPAGGLTRVVIEMRDSNDAPLSGLAVTGDLRRVVESRSDQSIVFEETRPGRYEGQVSLAFPGRWEGRFTAQYNESQRLDFEDTLWVE